MSEHIGCESQKDILLGLAKSGELSHALIIECDKTQETLGFIMNVVKTRLCTAEEKPCGKCGNCMKIERHSHPDVVITEATGKNKSVKIDDIRKIREDAYIISNEGAGKFYIIKDADFMTVQAQNALIKILEDPPKNVIFVLICESSGNLLSTVRSRSHIFKIKNASEGKESEILDLSKEIVKQSISGRGDKILECFSEFGLDRKKFKILLESIIESFMECFKNEDMDKSLAESFILKVDRLRDLSVLVDKNVNMNLLATVVCSCL